MSYATLPLRRLVQLLMHPEPYRVRLLRPLFSRFRSLPYDLRLMFDAMQRPHYGYCVLHAARLAKQLGVDEITAIEFGVAGGNGLVTLEDHAECVSRETGVAIRVVGFDRGSGLPEPKDYRDMPNIWQSGFYQMDIERLRGRLRHAELYLGEVGTEIEKFLADDRWPPVGAIVFDLDFYSSTIDSFRVFDLASERILPRVFCYFDDIIHGDPISGVNNFTGQCLAIDDYNQASNIKKLALDRSLMRPRKYRAQWHQQIYLHHDFCHPAYTSFVGTADDQRPLTSA
ncbi:MAG: hypothetical protein ACR2Q4_07715 [Geminicoccaceae bacterium]